MNLNFTPKTIPAESQPWAENLKKLLEKCKFSVPFQVSIEAVYHSHDKSDWVIEGFVDPDDNLLMSFYDIKFEDSSDKYQEGQSLPFRIGGAGCELELISEASEDEEDLFMMISEGPAFASYRFTGIIRKIVRMADTSLMITLAVAKDEDQEDVLFPVYVNKDFVPEECNFKKGATVSLLAVLGGFMSI